MSLVTRQFRHAKAVVFAVVGTTLILAPGAARRVDAAPTVPPGCADSAAVLTRARALREADLSANASTTALSQVFGPGAVPLTSQNGVVGYEWRRGGSADAACMELVTLNRRGGVGNVIVHWLFPDRFSAVVFGGRLVRALAGESSVPFGSPIQWPDAESDVNEIEPLFLEYSDVPTHVLTLKMKRFADLWYLYLSFSDVR